MKLETFEWLVKRIHASALPNTNCKSVLCTEKLLKIKSKLILILFTFIFLFIFYFFVVQNVVGKIDKKTLRIGFRIDPTFLFKKITKKAFTIR